MDPLPTSNQEPESSGDQEFKPKPLEQPILDASLRNKIASDIIKPAPLGLKGFYKANKLYVWAIALGLLIIGVLSFLVLRSPAPKPQKEANVEISFADTKQTAQSGGEQVFVIKVQNNDSQKLTDLQIELAYPDGISYTDSRPVKAISLSGNTFKVPDLLPGQNTTFWIKTKISGNINDEKKLTAKLHYKFSNSNLEFTKEQQFTVRLVASDMVVEIDGPQNANNAQLVAYTVRYKNNSSQDIKAGRIVMIYPQGFDYAQGQPLPDMGNNTWNVGTVPAGKDGTLTVQGNFRAANPGEGKTATAEFQVLGQDGKYYTQSSASFTTTLSSLPLLVSQELQNSDNQGIIRPGDRLDFTVKYQNNAAVAATGVNIVVNLESKALDLSTLQAEGGQINGNSVLWNASTVNNLDSLNPSDSGQVTFSVSLKNPATRDSSKNLSVISSVKIKSNEYDTYLPGNQLTLKIFSPIDLFSGLNYISGSLPPQVGRATVYKVKISLKNATNDYSDGVINLSLPSNGFVDGSVNQSERAKTTFDSATNKLTWNFGSLPAHTGTFSQAKNLEFNVRINPSSAQANQSPVLVKDIIFNARDLYTGQIITIDNVDEITTNDLSSQDGWGNGIVQP